MDLIQSLVLGVVQGLTEFIPISSLAHFLIFDRMIQANANISFFVNLQIGTVAAILLFQRKKLQKLISNEKISDNESLKFIDLLVGSFSLLIVTILLYEIFKFNLSNLPIVGVGLIITSLVLILSKFTKGVAEITIFKSVIVGIVQSIGAIAGISRIAFGVTSGYFIKFSKEDMFDFLIFTYLFAIIPIIIINFIMTGLYFDIYFIVGIIASAVSSFISIYLLKKSLANDELSSYWVYCLIIGIILLFN